MNSKILELLNNQSFRQETLQLYQNFHEYPELSSSEFQTADTIKKMLLQEGFTIEAVEGTGFVAVLNNGPGKSIGLRAELDGLPIQENPCNLKQARKFISKNEGYMHACGHDAHQTILIQSLKFLANHLDLWSGQVVGIFEEGEEKGSGIQAMVQYLQKFSLDYIYGNHVFNELETGKINIKAGPIMASYGVFDISIYGQGGHGSRPDRAINPILIANQIISNLYQRWGTVFGVEDIVTLSVTKVNAGNTLNIIPDKCSFGGTIRFFDDSLGKKAMELIRLTVNQMAELLEGQVSFNLMSTGSSPVVNDSKLSQVAENILHEMFPSSVVKEGQWYASETFSQYQSLCSTLLSLVGIKNEDYGSGAEHHNEHFDIDPDSLFYGIGLMIGMACQLLSKSMKN